MDDPCIKPVSIKKEELELLLESSYRSIPFNIIIGIVVSINFYVNNVPYQLIVLWFSGITLMSIGRWWYSKFAQKNPYNLTIGTRIAQFCVLTFITGIVWSACYFIFSPYLSYAQEFLIILVLGGMCAGGLASLSVYMPAYLCFLLPIFLPIISLNFYIFKLDQIIVGVMCLLFTLMLIVTAKINSNILKKNIFLAKEKDKLISELQDTNQKLEKSVDEIRQMSITDSLTGLYNRRHFNDMLRNEFNRAKRNQYSLTLVMIDVDNFKYINDTYGHPYGDRFLIEVSKSIKNAIKRSNDSVFRLGGDEFAVLLANLSMEDSLILCGHIQHTFQENVKNDQVSLSMGVISIASNNSVNVEKLISIADTSLYEAKKQGKNKVISRNIEPDDASR